jgi:hypothetical protein
MIPNDTQALTSETLIRRGYFPIEFPPPFVTDDLANSLSGLGILDGLQPKASRPALFSIPKSWPARRILSIPNPLHQILLAEAVEQHWADLKRIFDVSTISVSKPTSFVNGVRAVSRQADFDTWSTERFQRSANCRFVLRTDLSRFYHTIYTHSLPWAIHGKPAAKADRTDALYGNLIDKRVRNAQDQQTMGLPVGPDTSFVLAEVIGARIDEELQQDLVHVKGTRYVDDFHLYFDTRAEAENAYSSLTRIAKRYELEVNDRKTEIYEGPDTGEPIWKTALKAQAIRGRGPVQRASLISYVSKVFDLARQNPGEGVVAYGVKKAATTSFNADNGDIYEAFLRASIVHDSSTMPLVTKLLFDRQQANEITNEMEITNVVSRLLSFHSQFRHPYEVCWLLWLARVLKAEVPARVIQPICEMDDSVVALLMLDLRELGLVWGMDTSRWETALKPESLYSDHWLLAYEAARREWLPESQTGYVGDDPFFSQLAARDVSFYSPPADSGVSYIWTGGYLD